MVADKGMTNEVCYFVGSTYIDNILEYNKDAIPFPWVSNTTDVNNYQKCGFSTNICRRYRFGNSARMFE